MKLYHRYARTGKTIVYTGFGIIHGFRHPLSNMGDYCILIPPFFLLQGRAFHDLLFKYVTSRLSLITIDLPTVSAKKSGKLLTEYKSHF